jgi:hypothetical protein
MKVEMISEEGLQRKRTLSSTFSSPAHDTWGREEDIMATPWQMI